MTVTADFDFIDREMTLYSRRMIDYLKYTSGQNKVENTLYKYAKGLEEFSQWLEQENIEDTEIEFDHLGRYLNYLMNDRGLANSTAETYFAPVNEYYKYLVKKNKISRNPVDRLDTGEYIEWDKTKIQDESDEERVYLEKDEIDKLIKNAPAPQLRNRLIIKFIYYTGVRVSEAVNVKRDNVYTDTREVYLEKIKGGSDHTVKYHEDLQGLMKQWLDYGYRDSYSTSDASPYLFLTNRSKQISVRRVNGIIDEAAENAGIQEVMYTDAAGREFKKVTPHKLRHSFAMHFLNDGGSIEALNNRLAHISVITTEIYGEIQDDRGMKEYDEHMQAVGSDSSTESYKCPLCGQKGNLEEHHISYEPEQTIDVCKSCHGAIHSGSHYNHLLNAECENYSES